MVSFDLESLFENPQKPASIFEQDNNNSFFSSNFSKLTNGKTSPGKIIYCYSCVITSTVLMFVSIMYSIKQ